MLAFIHDSFRLDLTHLSVTFSEINQWFKDDFSTEFSLPFEFRIDSELSKKSGFEAHYNSNNTQRTFTGYLSKDGEITEAVLKFQSIKGKVVSAVINAGLDNFANFGLKLSELDLENHPVDDLIADANEVIRLSYPETNYNFPMVHTDKYDPESEGWNGFLKVINNHDGTQFIANSLGESSNLDVIANIMQPLPYLMHVLKAGVSASGKTLAGDILEDETLKRALIFRDGEYYNRTSSEEIPIVYKNNEYDELAYVDNNFQYVTFEKEIVVQKKGDYLVFGDVYSVVYSARKDPAWSHDRYRCSKLYIKIEKVSGGVTTTISNFGQDREDTGQSNLWTEMRKSTYDIEASFEAGDIIKITKTEPKRDYDPSPTPNYPEAISLKLIPVRYKNPDGSPILSLLNLNEINLTKVVPDMSFRDLITIVKNWFNYEFVPSGDVVYMNYIENKLDRSAAKDLRDFDVEEPLRNFNEERTYELAFTDGKTDETYKYDSVLVTASGAVVNNYVTKDTVSQITIDALPLPVVSRNGVTTAHNFSDEDSKLRIVFKKPTPAGVPPEAFWEPAVTIPEVYDTKYKRWLDFRINSVSWSWDFVVSVEKMKDISVQSIIYAYDNYHILSELEKERLDEFWWRINAKTESLL